MAFSGPMEDQFAIRTLHDRYADAVFRRDAAAWGECWTDDAVWNLSGMTVAGKPAIVALWEQAMAGFTFVAFFVQPGSIEVDGTAATGRVYTSEVLEDAAGVLARTVGLYEDSYARDGSGWRYRARSFSILKG